MSWTTAFITALAIMSAEPWGAWSAPLSYLPHAEHSAGTETRTRRDLAELKACEAGRGCTLDQLRFLSWIGPARKVGGRVQLALVNRAINTAIHPDRDVLDEWYGPMETVTSGKGDCEDFAIVKLFALRALGWNPQDLALMVVYVPRRKEYHAVAVARVDESWLILDTLTTMLVAPEKSGYIPHLLLRDGTVRRYLVTG